MTRRSFVRLGLAVTLAVLSTGRAAAQATPLNVVIITADDMNADSPGWNGNKLRPTPNLDAFAARAHRFVNCHVSAPICQPCREALMSGRVPHRSGGLGFNPIRPDVPTLVTLLAARGYYTAAINKIVHMMPQQAFPWDTALDGTGKNPKALRKQLAQCLATASERKKPFFINVNITDPHRPFPGGLAKKEKIVESPPGKTYSPDEVTVPSFLEDIPKVRREVAQYMTGVRRFDESFGEVMAELVASGRLGETIVVFLSDHGMSFPFSKASIYRNGTWSPILIAWPGMPPARAHEEMVSSVDLLPTLLDLTGAAHPPGLDGQTWLPLLRNEPQAGRDHVVTHVNTVSSGKSFPQRCVRTKQYALQFHAWADGKTSFKVEAMSGLSYNALAEAAKSDPRIKSRVDQYIVGTPLAFYDVQADPDERVNRIGDAKLRSEIDRHVRLLKAHMERTEDPQLAAFQAAIRKMEKH